MSTDRKITLAMIALIALCLGALMLQGDPCDSTANPDQCRVEVPER